MNFNILATVLSVALLTGCASNDPAFDIRSPDRPDYLKTISPADIDTFLEQGGVLVDARLSEDFAMAPALIPGAIRVDPEHTEYWLSANKNVPVTVYCVKGKWVSQKTAAHLSSLGFEAYSLAGGYAAYQEFARADEWNRTDWIECPYDRAFDPVRARRGLRIRLPCLSYEETTRDGPSDRLRRSRVTLMKRPKFEASS